MSFWVSKSRNKRTRAKSTAAAGNGKQRTMPLITWLLAGLTWAVVMLLLSIGNSVHVTNLAVGQRAPETVVATTDFSTLDLALTELIKTQAAEDQDPIFSINPHPLNTALRSINKLFDQADHLSSAYPAGEITPAEARGLHDTLDLLEIDLEPQALIYLAPTNHLKLVRQSVIQALTKSWNSGIFSPEDTQDSLRLLDQADHLVLIRSPETMGPRVKVTGLANPAQATEAAVAQVVEQFQDFALPAEVLQRLMKPWLTSNLVYEPALTEARREEARDATEPVFSAVRAGTTLMQAGERVTPDILEQLKAHRAKLDTLQTNKDRVLEMIGNGTLLLGALFIFGGFIYLTQPSYLKKPSYLGTMTLLSVITLLVTRGLIYLSYSLELFAPAHLVYLAPLALAPLVATILITSTFGIAVGIWTTFTVAILFDNSFAVFSMGLIITIVAVLSATEIHKRSNIFRAGLWIGAAKLLCCASLGILHQQSSVIMSSQCAAAFSSGILAALMALLVIPIFELLFKFTTDIKLLELSDMSHPLLQRLALEAPGTYHHSLMVANLAQSAAGAIGANKLLVRVCAYYHDIGKLTKPEFFIENSHQTDNPHDDLSPSMSTLVIISHVKEGVSMAVRHNLPEPIKNAIQQHHGTSIMNYFYHQAKQTADNDEKASPPNVEDYRYPGPKPDTPEMGILMLSDSMEAASRSMEKPSPSNIAALVESITNEYLHDGQLDRCGLTVAQLALIKDSLIFNLNNMLHGRIPYPTDENRNNKPPETVDRKPVSPDEADKLVDAASASG